MQRWAARVLLASLLLPATAGADAIDDLAPGTWYEIPNSQMRDVCPPDSPGYEYSFHCQNVINAWGGAALDTTRGRMLVWGGGHGDYKGNEVYAFDLTTLTWERIWGPTPDAQIPSGDTHEEYDDGNPGSRHTYSGLSYVPAPVDAMFAMGGSLWQSGSYGAGTWRLDLGTLAWQRMTDGPSEQGYGDPSVYDPVTGHVFRRANSRMLEYDPVGDTFTDGAESNGGFYLDDVSAALDPEARLMVMMGEDRVDLYRIDTDEYSQDIAINGTAPNMGESPGLAFDTQQKQFVVWTGGATTYTFDPAAASFSQHDNPNGTAPGPVTPSGGVFGRFRYVPSRNVFVSINSVDENVFVLRMSEGTGEPLPPPPDGGATGGGAGVTGNGGSGGSGTGGSPASGGASAKADAADDDGGCGCRVSSSSGRGLAAMIVLGALCFARRPRAQGAGGPLP
jgi:hypothetical protein